MPQIVIPTTYAGSEATAILGQTELGRKTTIADPRVQPEVILYDPELLLTLPVSTTMSSALNAMAHAAEALYARSRNPVSSILAIEGMRAFASGLPRIAAEPHDVDARGKTLHGAWLCGTVLGQVGMALHHKLCHALGGSFNLPHAETHAIILPHAITFNERAFPSFWRRLPSCWTAITRASRSTGSRNRWEPPLALRDLGLAEDNLDRAAEIATENPYWNPQTVERYAIRALLQAAWEGAEPHRGHRTTRDED